MKHAFADLPAGQMHYVTDGKGLPLLLIHQSSFSLFEFEKVIPILAKRYRVFASDTLGYGYSDAAPLTWNFEDFVRSYLQFMDTVGLTKASLLGHHTGALIAAELAASHPERVDRLILSGCAVYEPALRKEKYAKQSALPPQGSLPPVADGSHSIGMWKKQQEENPESSPEFVHKAMIANFLHYDKPNTGNAFTALLGFDIEPRLRAIRNPTLVIAGSKDVIRPPSFKPADIAAKLIPGAKFKLIEGGAIGIAWEMPEQFTGAILEFLGKT